MSTDHHKETIDAVLNLMCIAEILKALGASGVPGDSESITATLVEWLGKRALDASSEAYEALCSSEYDLYRLAEAPA